MKTRKQIILVMTFIAITSITFSLYLEFSETNFILSRNFLLSLSLSLFGSTFLVVVIAILEFTSLRKEIMEEYYLESIKIMNCYLKLRPYDNDCSNEQKLINALNKYVDVSELDLTLLGNLYSSMHFIFFNKKKKAWIFKELYSHVNKMNTILKEKTYHFNLYLDGELKNKKAVLSILSDAEKELFDIIIRDENDYKYEETYCKFTDKLDVNLEFFRSKIYG